MCFQKSCCSFSSGCLCVLLLIHTDCSTGLGQQPVIPLPKRLLKGLCKPLNLCHGCVGSLTPKQQSSDILGKEAQSPKEPLCHGQLCILPWHRDLPHNKGSSSSENWQKRTCLWQWELCSVQTRLCCPGKRPGLDDIEQQNRFLNLGSAHIQHSRSLTWGHALSLCHWSVVFVLYFSAQWLKHSLCCARWFSCSKHFCTGICLLLLGPNPSSHTWSASNLGNSSVRNFWKSQWIAIFFFIWGRRSRRDQYFPNTLCA